MTGKEYSFKSTPSDFGDFGRCYRLIKLIPEWENRLPDLAKEYGEWERIIKNWKTLSEHYERNNTGFLTWKFILGEK